ncbi:MAG: nitrous oxide reductase family maturation protein NosD [Phycisphaerales bacterium]|nr:nitrous oxide reductase family maturation protein NosD [Phycisphaerales bacterium]
MNTLLAVITSLAVAAGPGASAAQPDLAALIRDAAPGSTIHVPAGVYPAGLHIDKPLTLIGAGRAILDGNGQGDLVLITAPNVELRGFLLRGTGADLDKENCAIRITGAADATIQDNTLEDVLFGIDVKESPRCTLRGNHIGSKPLDIARRGDTIRLYRANDALIENNTILDGRDAVLWYSTGVTARGNTARRCRYGFHLMYSDHVTLEDNDLADNSVGVYFMYSSDLTLTGNRITRNRGPSGYGLGLKETDRYHVEGNLFAANRVGIYIDGSPFRTPGSGQITDNTFAANDTGLALLPSVKGNRVWANRFLDNTEQLSVLGKGELVENEFDIDERGNYWSDYTGYDLDGDGVGEIEYEPTRLFENLMDKEPRLRLMLFSPAQQAVDFVGRALPAVQPQAKFTDWYPLVSPPPAPAAIRSASHDGPGLALIASVLAAIAAAVAAVALEPREPRDHSRAPVVRPSARPLAPSTAPSTGGAA